MSVILVPMSTWAVRRKLQYGGGAIAFLIMIIAIPVFLSLHKSPTCFDGDKNGNELGIDCGGSCVNICGITVRPLVVEWSRALNVSKGIYSVVAYVENLNTDIGAKDTQYVFKVYDENNILITERFGKTEIPADRVFPIFESDIRTGERVPARTFFEFIDEPEWVDGLVFDASEDVIVTSRRITGEDTEPRLDVVIENTSLRDISDIITHAVLFDSDGNAVAASKIVLKFLSRGEEKKLTFTWPLPFDRSIAKIEVHVTVAL